MHTVTFYSFKGGVGRTLALVNIGVELANTGRKVLLVDFDLEAPGIDTFDALSPKSDCRGIVDYVTEYLGSERPPDFADYHYGVEGIGQDSGELCVMPAGQRDADYGAKLASIDWQELYAQKNGFLLIEDLKRQWEESLNPDYVLIDSRTGHTEVGGICTRQLPDTVVVLFIPNEQNLVGASAVVDAIRAEQIHNKPKINVELVASNVPVLDDEHEILRSMMRKFEKRLGSSNRVRKRRQVAMINRYDSLHLLNQTIFVTERPRSSLAKQYRSLLRRIVGHNLEDREAALRAISNHFPRAPQGMGLKATDFESIISEEEDRKIRGILHRHAEDAEINFMIGQFYKSRGSLEDARVYFARAAQHATAENEIAKYRLEVLETDINQGKTEGVAEQLLEVLEDGQPAVAEIRQALGLLVRIDASPSSNWIELPALTALSTSDLSEIAWQSDTVRSWQEFIMEVYRAKIARDGKPAVIEQGGGLTLAAIATKNYDVVLASIDESGLQTSGDISECFNYAMARWGKEGQPDPADFKRVLVLDEGHPSLGANYEQCLAISAAIAGDTAAAKTRLKKSRATMEELPLEFSCWRYLRVAQDEFLVDLDEISLFIDGQTIQPAFMR